MDGEGSREGARGLLGGRHAVEKAPAKLLLQNRDGHSLDFS